MSNGAVAGAASATGGGGAACAVALSAAIVLDARSAALLEGTVFGNVLRFLEGVLTFALAIYVPYYLYRAMRRVYGQGRLVTLAKYSLFGIGYVFFMALTAIGLLFYTALTL